MLNTTVRAFKKGDEKTIIELDELSGNDVQQWNEDFSDDDFDNDYSWGIFYNDKCIGYCTIGYADDMCSTIEDHPIYQDYRTRGKDCYYLSDVYIKPEFRHRGFGLELISQTIAGRFQKEFPAPVFLEVCSTEQQNFYMQAGFLPIDDCSMIYPIRRLL